MGKRASGTSVHKVNLNPNCGTALTLLHNTLVRICRSGTRMEVVENVRKEGNRTKTIQIESAVKTRWNSDHEECRRANINQKDLKIAISRMISRNGIDKDLFKANENQLAKVIPTDADWRLYQQYESGIDPLRRYSLFTQSSKVVVHMELFEARVLLEKLGASYFAMFENLSIVEGARSRDLTKRLRNHLVVVSDFIPTQELTDSYAESHEMIHEVRLARRIAYRELAVRLGLKEVDPTFTDDADEAATDCNLELDH